MRCTLTKGTCEYRKCQVCTAREFICDHQEETAFEKKEKEAEEKKNKR